ncbi:MAG: hypothetical protein JWQ43_49, partial [Glaciihabitans sp.]|nr:hypothetical protein [Glaciihabitans sp.]
SGATGAHNDDVVTVVVNTVNDLAVFELLGKVCSGRESAGAC